MPVGYLYVFFGVTPIFQLGSFLFVLLLSYKSSIELLFLGGVGLQTEDNSLLVSSSVRLDPPRRPSTWHGLSNC